MKIYTHLDFTLVPVPTFIGISPNFGPTTGGTDVTIAGTNFVDGSSLGVTIGGSPASNIYWIDAERIAARTPSGTVGSQQVVVTNGDGHIVPDNPSQAWFIYQVPPTAPTFLSAETNTAGNTITISFSKTMANPTGQHGSFTYQIGGGLPQSFSAAALNTDTTKIDLTTSGTAIAFGDTVTVSYTSGTVQAVDGGILASFGPNAVTNNMPSGGGTPVTTCTVINTPGTYVLQNDIMDSTATKCIDIRTSDVIFDGNGHTIDGVDTSSTYGIYAYNVSKTQQNITIQNGSIKDWGTGLYHKNGVNSTIDRINISSSEGWGMQFEDLNYFNITNNIVTTTNTYNSITFYHSNHNIIQNNLLKDNGYPSSSNGIGIGISYSSYNNVSDNIFINNTGGIRAAGNGLNNSIFNNTLSNNRINIDLMGENFSFFNNTIGFGEYGVYSYYGNNNTFTKNTFFNSTYGVWLRESDDNRFFKNDISNSSHGIYFYEDTTGSNRNDIISNNFFENNRAIYIDDISHQDNLIRNNYFKGNPYGIFIEGTNTYISDNIFTGNYHGLIFIGSNATVINNSIDTADYGISIMGINCSIINNTIFNVTTGISSGGINHNYVIGNNISNNQYGITPYSNTTYSNNYFNNTQNVKTGTILNNTWNTTKTSGTNIIGGSYLGGNYWANPSGTGYSQTCINAGDGICSVPYTIGSGNVDNLPLTNNLVIPAPTVTLAETNAAGTKITITFNKAMANPGWQTWGVLI